METNKRPVIRWKATRWERRLLTAFATALSAELFFNLWVDNFRVSAAVVLFPVLLMTLVQDSRRPATGAMTAMAVLVVRCVMGMLGGEGLWYVASREYPGALFYLLYDGLLCVQVPNRSQTRLLTLWRSFWVCDAVSNGVNLTLSRGGLPEVDALVMLMLLALGRSLLAVVILWAIKQYRRLLLAEEHERRYQRLFLLTANLKNELYFLKKDAENIEGIMSRAYTLYEKLGGEEYPEELRQLALSIARDVHEVKKDNLSIIRGIEGEVADTYNEEKMHIYDLLHILRDTMTHILGERQTDIVLDCRCATPLATGEHYQLMSILKNLVMNASEAIQSGKGSGIIWVDAQEEGEDLVLTVRDTGPGISQRAMQNLFQVGYSTKFDPKTGNINRGVGLPAVKFMVEELGGVIEVTSTQGAGACFRVILPISRLEKGAL